MYNLQKGGKIAPTISTVAICRASANNVEQNTKKDLRVRLLNLLRTQKEGQRLKKSTVIREKLFSLPEFKDARTILFYASFDGEVETFEMMKYAQKLKKKIALPKIIQEDKEFIPVLVDNIDAELSDGCYGIKEPNDSCAQHSLSAADIDMVLVPGVAFDKDNNRLGRGGGYYDRFLKTLPSTTTTVGLSFDFQMLDSVPHQKNHDVPLSCVIVN